MTGIDPAWEPTSASMHPEGISQVVHKFSTECERRLGYHPVASDKQKKYYETNRMKFMELYDYLALLYHPSRELSLALTELQNALMWANAHVACNNVGAKDE